MSEDWKETLKKLKNELPEKPEQVIKKDQTFPNKLTKSAEDKPLPPLAISAKQIPKSRQIPNPSTKHPEKIKIKAPLPNKPIWNTTGKRVNIGLDFGTSTTKVSARAVLGLSEDIPTYVLDFGNGEQNKFLCPSSVLIKNNKVYFGFEAEQHATIENPPFRHLKVCLSCEAENQTLVGLEQCRSQKDSRGICTGLFSFPTAVWGSQLVTLFLAWAMKEARTNLPINLGNHEISSYNIGIPIDQLDMSSPLKTTYEKITYDAWSVSNGVNQGIELSKALNWLEQIREEAPYLPEYSPIQLCPETTAAILSFTLARNSPIGLYGLLDIGAWTTDISVFRLTDISLDEEGVPTLSFPIARTERVACNAIDQRTFEALKELWNIDANLPWIQTQRESGSFGRENEPEPITKRIPPKSALTFSKEVIAKKIGEVFKETLKDAHASGKEPYQFGAWENFKLFLLGGGSFDSILRNIASKFPVVQSVSDIPLPLNIRTSRNGPVSSTDYKRLAISYGLAFPKGLWPKVFSPDMVAPLNKPSIKERPDRDDLYPK